MTNIKKWKWNRLAIICACLHWIFSFITDQFIFQYIVWDLSSLKNSIKTMMTYGCKVIFLIILLLLWHGIFWFVKKADRRFVTYTCIYFVINMLVLFLVWPGIWRMDEFGILNAALKLQPNFWQNYLTSVFYIFSVMLIPIPTGVIIVQIAVISLMVGYLIFKIEDLKLVRGKLAICCLFLPFLLFPVIDSNMYPIRMSLYAFLELLLLAQLFFQKKEMEHSPGNVLDKPVNKAVNKDIILHKNQIMLFLLAGVVCVLRTEAIYYIVAFPVLFVLVYRTKYSKKMLAKSILLFLGITILLYLPQKVGERFSSNQDYELTSVLLPIVPLVEAAANDVAKDATYNPKNEEILKDIDGVINVSLAITGAKEDKTGIQLFWSKRDEFVRSYSPEDFSFFKKAYYQLVLKYPGVFLKERWNTFYESVDLLENTTELFEKKDVPNYETFQTYPGTKPWNQEIRNALIKLLELRSAQDYTEKLSVNFYVYTPIFTICVLFFGALGLLFCKKWKEALLLAVPLAKVPLIFLTAPSRLFMYYYSVYLIGSFFVGYLILHLLTNKRKQGGTGE